jgi:hypothetical protein
MCNMGSETEPFTHQRKVQNIRNTIISSFFSIVTFLGWTRLQATWIKPEVVATKKYTGCLHYRFITTWSRFLWSPCCSYMCFFLVLVWPCQLFVRLWYRVSYVLDLSLVSKRFGFWPHITHDIVLAFKEIKHLSDYRTDGRSDCRNIGLSDYRLDPSPVRCTYILQLCQFYHEFNQPK